MKRSTFVLISFLITTLLVSGCGMSGSTSAGEILGTAPPTSREPPSQIWFDDIAGATWVTESDGEALARYVTASIFDAGLASSTAPEILSYDTFPRIIFLSISDGESPAVVMRGAGIGIAEAIEQALSQAQMLTQTGYQPRWVKLDITREAFLVADFDPSLPQPPEYERSLFGLAFDQSSGLAFLPEELVSHTLLDSDQLIRFPNIEGYLEEHSFPNEGLQRLEEAERLSIYRFSTLSFFSDGEETLRLYRGHRMFDQLPASELLSAAIAGGRYLTEAVGPDGRFVYIYHPKSDEEVAGYNILRHAGTTYAMLELYEVTRDEELLRAAERAIGYLVAQALPCETGSETLLCIVEEGEVKLGGNALAIVSLVEYIEVTGNREYLPVAIELGRWIQATQDESGELAVHKMSYPGGEVHDFTSEYYPGEALLALTRLYAIDPDEGWLDTAERGALWLINVRDGGVPIPELSHDHWLLYALNELYRYRPNPIYLEHTSRIATAIVQSQNREPAYPDWLGSYYRPPRSTPAATRTEGLYAAYLLIRDFGSTEEAEAILEAARLGGRFQLQTQFRPESAMYLDNPQRVLGGFHHSLTNYEIRIDYVQHNISALLGLYRIASQS